MNLQNYVLQKGGADNFLHFGSKNTSEIKFTFNFKYLDGNKNQFFIELGSGSDQLFIDSMRVKYQKEGEWKEAEIERKAFETKLIHLTSRGQDQYINQRLFEFVAYHLNDTSNTSPIKKIAAIHNNEALRRDYSNIAPFLYYLQEKEPKHFKRIELTIQSIAPFFDRFDLKPNRLNEQTIQLEWREKGFPDNYFNAYHLSDGTLRFICLATLLMQPNPPKTIVIDEPELGLHPVAINKLAALIRKASAKTQIILSTQSINLIDNFEPEDIIVTDRENHESVFRRLKSEDLKAWLEEYTLGDLWGKNKFGAQPYSV